MMTKKPHINLPQSKNKKQKIKKPPPKNPPTKAKPPKPHEKGHQKNTQEK